MLLGAGGTGRLVALPKICVAIPRAKCCCYRMQPPAYSRGLESRRFFSQKAGGGKSDQELAKEYEGPLPRMRTFLASDRNAIEEALKTLPEHILPQSRIGRIVLWTDLQNPILQRYPLQLDSFMDGARQAVMQIRKALFSKDICAMRRTGERKATPNLAFLQDALTPAMFATWTSPGFNMRAFDYVVHSTKSLDMRCIHIRSRVVEAGSSSLEEMLDDTIKDQAAALNAFMRLLRNDRVVGSEVDDVVLNPDGTMTAGAGHSIHKIYPLNSVLLEVVVSCRYEEEVYYVETQETVRRRCNEHYIFLSCISGEVPQNWVLSRIRSMAIPSLLSEGKA